MTSWRYDGEGPQIRVVEEERPVRARKAHTCATCFKTIERGETYLRSAVVVDGEFRVIKAHPGMCWMYG